MNESRSDIQIKRFEIVSNKGKTVEISNGFAQLYYYESILENTVKATVTYADTGNRNYAGETSATTEANDVDLQYAEKVFLDIEDDERGRLQFITDDTCLHFMVRPKVIGTTRSEVVSACLSSKEYLTNNFEENRVARTYEGKISETVKKIFTEHLKTKKPLFIEDTLNNLKIAGRIDDEAMPFNVLNQLSAKSIPIVQSKKTEGNTAGYFFYETSDGYHFKSVDKLLSQEPLKRYVMNNTTKLPFGYDGKILAYAFSEGPSLIEQMKAGTNSSTIITFNPVTQQYERKTINSTEQNAGAVRAAKNLPFIPEDLYKSTKTNFSTLDIGQLSYGVTVDDQLQNSIKENFNVRGILNQSTMRYNQLFSIQLQTTIFCDLTLHAGDLIECSFPEVSSKYTQMVSKKKSGKYLIVDLCHYISPAGPNFTKLNLVRDSYGG
jgi:hypothetical protein